MGRYLVFLTVALVLVVGAAQAQFAESVLPNGDFEEGLEGWGVSVSDAKNLGVAVIADETQAKHGARSVKMTLPGGPSGATVSSAPAPVQGGQYYLVTFHFRSEGFSETGLFAGVNLQYTLNWSDAENKPVPGPGGAGLTYGEVKEWRFRCTLFRAPEGATSVRMGLAMSCDDKGRASSAWFDRIQIRPWTAQAAPEAKSTVYNVSDGVFDAGRYRRVADDDTATGFAVIANPKFGMERGYLAGGLYLRTLPPGQYRVIFRLKVGEIPAEPQGLLQWDLNTATMGYLNAGAISTAEFQKAGVYQDFAYPFVLPPEAGFVDPRVVWNGGTVTWIDTITVVQERVYTEEEVKALTE